MITAALVIICIPPGMSAVELLGGIVLGVLGGVAVVALWLKLSK